VWLLSCCVSRFHMSHREVALCWLQGLVGFMLSFLCQAWSPCKTTQGRVKRTGEGAQLLVHSGR